MRALILGARGQLGSRFHARLAAAGHEVVGTSRSSGAAGLTRFDPFADDWRELGSFDVVIQAVGVIEETRGATFERVHVELARRLAAAHGSLGEPRVLQVSALGARVDSPARFLATKAEGDRVLMDALGARVLVLRPSIVCTPGTRIARKLVRLARCARFTGGVFPVPAGLLECRLQPILCDDLERAVLGELAGDTGGVLELAGRDVVRLGELVGMAFRARGLRPRPIRLPGVFWSAAASLCPRLISREELVLVGEDNILGRSREAATRSFVGSPATEFFRLALSH